MLSGVIVTVGTPPTVAPASAALRERARIDPALGQQLVSLRRRGGKQLCIVKTKLTRPQLAIVQIPKVSPSAADDPYDGLGALLTLHETPQDAIV